MSGVHGWFDEDTQGVDEPVEKRGEKSPFKAEPITKEQVQEARDKIMIAPVGTRAPSSQAGIASIIPTTWYTLTGSGITSNVTPLTASTTTGYHMMAIDKRRYEELIAKETALEQLLDHLKVS